MVDRYQAPASQAAKPVEPEKPKIDWNAVLKDVDKGTIVMHKTFGEGVVSNIDKLKNYMKVKFGQQEKQFVFPDAFVKGFLSLK